mmetsp:Transcript_2818/g.6851  ORF Transcript_2818/g.6851 Transcript_2818/m.6851 type:complete len:241 (-) Transcript_2818:1419-2141(-)
MSFPHAFVSEASDQGQIWLELLKLCLDLLGDTNDVLQIFILLHRADGLEQQPDASSHLTLTIPWVDVVEAAVEPSLFVVDPIPSSLPQVGVGLEGFDHGAKIGVVRLVAIKQDFTGVELPHQILACFDLIVRLLDLVGYFADFIDVLVLAKVLNDLLQSIEALIEGFLVTNLLVQELLMPSIQILFALCCLGLNIAGSPKHLPSRVQGLCREDIAKVLNEVGEVHRFLHTAFQLPKLARN